MLNLKQVKFTRGLAQWNREAAIAYCQEHRHPLVLADVPQVNPDPKWTKTKQALAIALAQGTQTLSDLRSLASTTLLCKAIQSLEEDGLCIEHEGRYTLQQLAAVAAHLLDIDCTPQWIHTLLEKKMLSEYIALKKQLAELELELKAIRESALQEALDLLDDTEEGKTFFYDGTKVTVRFVPRPPSPEHPQLEAMRQKIDAERFKLADAYSEELAELHKKQAALRDELASLEAQEQALLKSETVQLLETEYVRLAQSLTEIQPVLVIG